MNICYVDKNGEPVSMQYTHHESIDEALSKLYPEPTKKKSHNNATLTVCSILILCTMIVSMLFTFVDGEESSISEKPQMDTSVVEEKEIVNEGISELIEPEDNVKYFKPEALSQELFNVVIKECEASGLPVNVALAIIKTETQTFATNSTNHNTNGSYDCGIMQINSTNIRSFAKIYECPEFAENPYEPTSNIRVGIRHLASMWNVYIDTYNQDEVKALLATAGGYNRGVTNQNRYKNIYEYNARAYAHYINLCNKQDIDINYSKVIPSIKTYLTNNIAL